jgi:predicted PurR-regulated permease PerM
MVSKTDLPRVTVLLLTLAAFAVIVAAMRAARSIVIPFLLATFITVIVTPFFFGLRKRGVSSVTALLIMILILIVAVFLLAGLVQQSAYEFARNQSLYQRRLEEQVDMVVSWADGIEDWLEEKGIRRPEEPSDTDEVPDEDENGGEMTGGDLPEEARSNEEIPASTEVLSATPGIGPATAGGTGDSTGEEASPNPLAEYLNPGSVMRFFSSMFNAFSSLLSNGLLILLIVIFMLLEAAILPSKVRALPGLKEETWEGLNETVETIRHYMALKTAVSILTGFMIYILLIILGVDFPLLLALLAFLLNFVPNIGSFIAGVPAVLLAVIEFGVGKAVIVAIGYVAINTLVGNVIEPRVMGRGLGLSPLIIIISLIFWGWVLGPVGMLLSVPLTAALRLALDSAEETRWIAVLMGPAPETPPPKKKQARA